MPRDPFWAKLHKQQVEQMLRIADETEDYVYDVLVPSIFPEDDPDERLTFLNSLDMDALAQNNPKLWARYSKDALGLQQRQNEQQMQALDELRPAQDRALGDFNKQVKPQQPFGMAPSTAANLGLDEPVSMGQFS